jgi:hypothetical protein
LRRRTLLNLLTLGSFLLCVVAVAAWAASFQWQYGIGWTEPQRLSGLGVTRGVVAWADVRQPPGGAGFFGPPHGRLLFHNPSPQRGPLGGEQVRRRT